MGRLALCLVCLIRSRQFLMKGLERLLRLLRRKAQDHLPRLGTEGGESLTLPGLMP